MSIRSEIAGLCAEGRLHPVQPQTNANSPVRGIYVSQLVWQALHGPWQSAADEIRLARARAALDNFIEGRLISVRFPPSKSVQAFIALLEPPEEEVWEIRARDPRPGVRILGRFAEPDVFIGLLPVYREDLGTSRDWDIVRQRCLTEWRKLFPFTQAFKGNRPHDYIGRHCVRRSIARLVIPAGAGSVFDTGQKQEDARFREHDG